MRQKGIIVTDNSEREVRAFRLLRMIYYLYSGNYTTRQLSRLLGVSIRTVQRDLLALQDSDLGFAIVNKTQCV